MRSYSFDLNITPKSNESSINEQIILIEFKWSNSIMIFLIFYFFVFSLYFNFFSVLVNIVILINFLHILIKIYQIKLTNLQSDNLGQEISNNSLINHKDFLYNFNLIIICFILGCLELLHSLATNYHSLLNSQSGSDKQNVKNYELIFSYMKFLFIIIKNLYLAFTYYYFKKFRLRIELINNF